MNRNTFLKTGIVCCTISVLFIIAVSFVVLPAYSSFDMEIFRRPTGIFQAIITRFFGPSFYAVHISISVLALYSLVSLCLIYYFFEKTQSQEIVFITLFIFSLSCESLRFTLILQQIYAIPFFYFFISSKILLFCRCFGLFSLFAASIFAVGLETSKQRNIIFIAAMASLIIALGTPIDTFTWETSFNPVLGYTFIFPILNGGVLLTTVASFLITAYLRGSTEYVYTGIGVLLACAGRGILFSSDSWAALPGIIPLFLGTWFIIKYLRKAYLWL